MSARISVTVINNKLRTFSHLFLIYNLLIQPNKKVWSQKTRKEHEKTTNVRLLQNREFCN